MSQKKRITYYLAMCYFAMSAALFFVFIYTYSYYFYKIQEQMIVEKARKSEELSLKIAMERFVSLQGRYELRKDLHDRLARTMARDKLDDLVIALNSKSDPVPLPKALQDEKKVDPAAIFIEDSAPVLKEEPALKPISKNELEKPFLDVFSRMSMNGKDLVDLRRFTKGMEQIVDISYILVDKRKVKLYKGEEVFDWEIRAYAVPFQEKEDSFAKKFEVLKNDPDIQLERFAIFQEGGTTALYEGKDFEVERDLVSYTFEKAGKQNKTYYEATMASEMALNQGNDEYCLKLTSYMVHPELKIAMVSSKNIFESDWTQFSFIERNLIPILAFMILAWIVCPILAWIAYKKASQFQFNLTVDLDGEEEVSSLPKYTKMTASSQLEVTPHEIEAKDQDLESEQQEVTEVKKTKDKAGLTFADLSKQTQASIKLEANTLQLESKDLDVIRDNNIRKSTGSFNRHKDEEKDTDYLAGVQSEVLKSLIKKLRQE